MMHLGIKLHNSKFQNVVCTAHVYQVSCLPIGAKYAHTYTLHSYVIFRHVSVTATTIFREDNAIDAKYSDVYMTRSFHFI